MEREHIIFQLVNSPSHPRLTTPQIQWLPNKKPGFSLGSPWPKIPSREWPALLLEVWGATGWCQAWRCSMISLGDKNGMFGETGTPVWKGNILPPGFLGTSARLEASAKCLLARQWAGALSNSDEESTKWTPEPLMSCAQWHGIKVKVDDQSNPGKGDVFSIPSR